MFHEEMNKRTVDIHTYMPVFREVIAQGKEVSLTITGNSMSPFLVHGRDQILIEAPSEILQKGDMAFYQRKNGDYVMHRICRVGQEQEYWFVGDAQTVIEGPIRRSQIFGKVTAVKRKGKWIRQGDFWWEFFRKFWLSVIPMRPWFCRIYTRVISFSGR